MHKKSLREKRYAFNMGITLGELCLLQYSGSFIYVKFCFVRVFIAGDM